MSANMTLKCRIVPRAYCALILIACAYFSVPEFCVAASQDNALGERKTTSVTAITSPIRIDGVLDETIWQTAPKIGDLTQREPTPGVPPTERTEVTLLHDAKNLYIGVICYDSEPQRVIGTQMGRDSDLGSDDRLQIVLDTYRDQRNAYYFSTSPAGTLVDGLVFANGQSNTDWDTIWNVRTKRTSQGWTAEFAIPFKSLTFPPDKSVWGFNISRTIKRKLEEDRWSGARLELQFFQISEAGLATNLEGLSQGIGLDVRPFLGGRWLRANPPGRNVFTGKPGVDLSYNITSNLKLSATVNTDFGETEVDARQVNLTRFSLFFPEKRSFFLEDAGVFSFSNVGDNSQGGIPSTRSQIIPFFSRTIGLLNGDEVPLNFGVKLTGKIGRTDLGILTVRTRAISPIVREKNFFVGRVKRNLLQQSYVGAVFTMGNPALPITSSTYGADLRLATSRFHGRNNLVFNAYALRSQNEGTTGRDWSYGVSAEYPNDLLQMEVMLRDIQENFRPSLGFVSRRNVRLFRVGGRFNPRPKDFLGLQQTFNGVYYTRFTRLDNGQVESWQLHFTVPMDWHFKSGDAIHSFFNPEVAYERLFVPFEISRGLFIPAGEYTFTRWRTFVMSAGKRRLQGNFTWVTGNYWSGHAQEFSTQLLYKIPPRFSIQFNTNQVFARLREGNFVTRIITGQLNYAFSPLLTFTNLVQYDNVSRNMGWQARLRWIQKPGNDVFVVFGQGWIQNPGGGYHFSAQDSKLSAKVQYTFRF